MTRLAAATPYEKSKPLGPEDFFDHVQYVNPFLSNRVSDPSTTEADVAAIHQRAFRELVACAEQARRERTSIGAVVWGEPGIGKSHLLARFCRWADDDDRACYVFLHNLQANPDRLPRYVLKCIVSRLTYGRTRRFHGTPLYWLVTRLVKSALERFPPAGDRATAEEAYRAFLHVALELVAAHPHAGLDARNVYEVLFRFFLAANGARHLDSDEQPALLAVRWLSGDELDREELARLGLGSPSDELTTLPDNQSIESVLLALAELAWHRQQPLVLCFDQVDNLDEEQIRALTQFLHPLLDHGRNLLVVTSGVQSKILDFVNREIILRAAWERLAQDERGIQLTRIAGDEARQLVAARLEKSLGPFAELPAVKDLLQADPLFPLGSAWLDQWLAGLVELRPRDAINWSRDRWREQQHQVTALGGTAWLEQWTTTSRPAPGTPQPAVVELTPEELARQIDEEVTRKLREQVARRELEPDTLPPDTANLSGLVEVLLRHLQQQPVPDAAPGETSTLDRIDRITPTRGTQPAHHLLVHRRCPTDGRQERIGVTFIATGNATSTTHALRRIVEDSEPADFVLLVCQQRQPLKLGAKGREHLATLEARGPGRFRCLELTFRQYAELDALQAVIGEARSGDLELDLGGGRIRPVTEAEVVASHHRSRRYQEHPLLAVFVQRFSERPGLQESEFLRIQLRVGPGGS